MQSTRRTIKEIHQLNKTILLKSNCELELKNFWKFIFDLFKSGKTKNLTIKNDNEKYKIRFTQCHHDGLICDIKKL